MTDKLDLPRRYRDQLEALLREHVPDAEVWAYGSRVTGKSHDGSDLDLVLRSPTLEPLDEGCLDLIEALEQSNIPILVQAHDWARLPESFHREIERDYVLVQRVVSEPKGTMEDGWAEIPFSEAVEINPSVPLDRGVVYPFVDMASVNADTRSAKSVQEREFQGGGSRFQDGDTLMARITPCLENGKIARYQSSGTQKDAHGSTEFIVIRGRPNVTDNDFAYYLTQWKEVRNYAIGQMTGTSGRQRVPVDSLDHLTVPLPPVSEQRTIAHILGTLDDKIELNRRMNQTLEEMARAIFQDWFVDFGPVRAKLEGREPYLPPELWDLFPDRLVDSALGEIPEGWEVKTLSGCIEVERGLSYKGSGLSSDGVPMHNLNSVYEGGGYKDHGIKYYSGDFQERHVAQPGDVIVANTEQGHDRLLIGFAAVLPQRFGDNGLFSHYLYRVRSQSGSGLSADFVCHLLNTQAMHDTVSGYATGTTVNMLPVDALRIPPTVIPPTQVLTTFSTISKTARMRQEFLVTEYQRLAAQRDVLLPKLMSGQVKLERQ